MSVHNLKSQFTTKCRLEIKTAYEKGNLCTSVLS